MNKFLLTEAVGARKLQAIKELESIEEEGVEKCCFNFKDQHGTTSTIYANRSLDDVIEFMESDDAVFDCQNKPARTATTFEPPFF